MSNVSVSYDPAPYAPKMRASLGNPVTTLRDAELGEREIRITQRHWDRAAEHLHTGGVASIDDTPRERDAWGHDPLPNGDTRMNMFGNITVRIGDDNEFAYHVFSVNKFSEYSTAHELVKTVLVLAEALGLDHTNSNMSAQPGSSQPSPNGASDHQPAQNTAPANQTGIAVTPAEATRFDVCIPFDYKLKDQYEAQYVGKSVVFPVWGFGHKIKSKKDGSGTYEVIEFYNENGNPIYDFNVFVPDASRMATAFDYKKIEPFVNQYTPQAGDVCMMRVRIIFKLNPSKRGDKIYWNIANFVPETDDLASAATTRPGEPAINTVSDHEVPF